MITKNTIPVKNPSILCTELDEEAVLLDLNTKCYYGLNEVALVIWGLIDGVIKVDGIVENICSKFDVTPQNAMKSVVRLLEELNGNKLINFKASV